jgi:hypothetical protein
MRHGSLFHVVTTAGLLLGPSLISDVSAATADHALAVSVDDFIYIDSRTSPPIMRQRTKSDCGLS